LGYGQLVDGLVMRIVYVNKYIVSASALAFAAFLGGCNGGSTSIPPGQVNGKQSYVQIELLSRPAVKEVFEKFVDHQTTNAVEPYNDPTLQGEIVSFTDALRPPNAQIGSDYGKALASVLYPNEEIVNLAATGKAAYLGYETNGATGGGSTFGGRDPGNDVVAISLGALFGNTLSALGLQPEDNEENNCLTNDNVTQAASQTRGLTFPYLAPPH
jgi:hypothetical protein